MSVRKPRKRPNPRAVAEALYAGLFGRRSPAQHARALETFVEADEGEQRFYIAHLTYLTVQAQSEALAELKSIREILEDLRDLVPEDDEPEDESEVIPDDEAGAPGDGNDAGSEDVEDDADAPPGREEGDA